MMKPKDFTGNWENKIEGSVKRMATEAVSEIMEAVKYSEGESEIERVMAAVFSSASFFQSFLGVRFVMMKSNNSLNMNKIAQANIPIGDIFVFQQVDAEITDGEAYRLDFLCATSMAFPHGNAKFREYLAVECDGMEFHERTKEQAIRDRKRDRHLLWGGMPTMRFLGAEIYADPLECLGEVATYFRLCRDRYLGGDEDDSE